MKKRQIKRFFLTVPVVLGLSLVACGASGDVAGDYWRTSGVVAGSGTIGEEDQDTAEETDPAMNLEDYVGLWEYQGENRFICRFFILCSSFPSLHPVISAFISPYEHIAVKVEYLVGYAIIYGRIRIIGTCFIRGISEYAMIHFCSLSTRSALVITPVSIAIDHDIHLRREVAVVIPDTLKFRDIPLTKF